MRFHLFAIFCSTLFYSQLSFSEMTFPVGHIEALMANTGAALSASPGNAIYNPAGLGFLDDNNVSVTLSGNALEQQSFEIPNMGNSSTVIIRPTLASTTSPLAKGHAAIFIANPVAFNVSQSHTSPLTGYNLALRLALKSNILMGGFAYGRPWDDTLAWGFTLGGIYTTQETYTYTQVTGPTSLATQYSQTFQKEIQPLAIAAALWKPTDIYNLGINISLQSSPILSEGAYYSSSTNSSTPTTPQEESRSYRPSRTSSVGAVLGQKFKILAQELYFDVSYSGGSDAKDYNGDNKKSDENFVYSLGWKMPTANKWQPVAGLAYSKLANSEAQLYSAGLIIKQRANEIVLGSYYYKVLPNANNQSAIDVIGLMFSSQVFY
ncbi:hypothetical protein DOM22_02405 [Bdellovibrio sp. ZAP7]|uniref:hypothetical protein n=1 Tax=Bdellovibrio sp. ZAP7 TaxID=2231053 RepID=UPI001158860C|nr:hypothetical protein [Bdellovibrio sp. ZAP7]QDK44090.1 hypothetical protein DOM22_02405 [Bdellovibrio sp. ZAP7]